MNIRRAVFPVAGFGTRFLPATKAMPKELLPITETLGHTLQETSPLISVVIPYYNAAEFIHEAIESVKAQQYQKIEIIISVDSNSTKCPDLNEIENVKTYVSDLPQGAGHTRYFGALKARGRFIAFLDADDLWKPNKLKYQLQFMIKNDLGFSFTDYIETKGSETIQHIKNTNNNTLKNFLIKKITIGCSSVMIDQQKNPCLIAADLKKRNDYQLWFSIITDFESRKIAWGSCCGTYVERRMHQENLSAGTISKIIYTYKLMKSFKYNTLKSLVLSFRHIINTAIRKYR